MLGTALTGETGADLASGKAQEAAGSPGRAGKSMEVETENRRWEPGAGLTASAWTPPSPAI